MINNTHVSKGDKITAQEWNRLQQDVARAVALRVASPLEISDTGSGSLLRWVDTAIRAIIVSSSSSSSGSSDTCSGKRYAWREIRSVGDTTWSQVPEGRSGSEVVNWAFEANGKCVDVGTHVLLFPGSEGEYVFWVGAAGEETPSSSAGSSGSSGSSGCQTTLQETDVRCENGVLNVYTRNNTLSIVNNCLTNTQGNWILSGTEGCCVCSELYIDCTARIASTPFQIPINDITANGRLGVIIAFTLDPGGSYPNSQTGWTTAHFAVSGTYAYVVYTRTLDGTETAFSLTEGGAGGGSQWSAVAFALDPGTVEVDFDATFYTGIAPATPTTFQTPANAIRIAAYGTFNSPAFPGWAEEETGCAGGGNNVATVFGWRADTDATIVGGSPSSSWNCDRGWAMSILYARSV